MMIQIAMYKGKGLIGDAIVRKWTRSIYSHCELIDTDIGRHMSSSLRDGGVRAKVIDAKPWEWVVLDLPWADADRVLQHFAETRSQRYGWVDLVRSQVFNRPFDEKGAAFCSEWCAAALGLPNPPMYSPQGLFDMCIYLNKIHG